MPRFLVHETAIHLIDTFRYLVGDIEAVFAWLRRLNPAIAGEDAGYLLCRCADGVAGLFDGNRLNDHQTDDPRRTMGEMWLEGEGGVLRLAGSGRLFWKPHRLPEHEHPYHWEDRDFGGDAVFATQAHILAHLAQGGPLEIGARDYLRNMRIAEAVYRSAAEGRWIEPEPI